MPGLLLLLLHARFLLVVVAITALLSFPQSISGGRICRNASFFSPDHESTFLLQESEWGRRRRWHNRQQHRHSEESQKKTDRRRQVQEKLLLLGLKNVYWSEKSLLARSSCSTQLLYVHWELQWRKCVFCVRACVFWCFLFNLCFRSFVASEQGIHNRTGEGLISGRMWRRSAWFLGKCGIIPPTWWENEDDWIAGEEHCCCCLFPPPSKERKQAHLVLLVSVHVHASSSSRWKEVAMLGMLLLLLQDLGSTPGSSPR